jgi:Tfp pilus assembly protein PilX
MRRAGRERGAVLLASLVLLSIVSVLAVSFLATSGLQLSVGLRERDRGRARALARSGVERARWELARDGGWAGTASEVPVGDGAGYLVAVAADATGAVTVTASGRHGAQVVTLTAEGWLRPYHGAMAISTQGGPISAQEGSPSTILEVDGSVHIDDPGASGIVSPEAVDVTGNVHDEQAHAFTLHSLGGAHLVRRADRPLPAVDLDALRAAATVVYPRDGAIPTPITGALSGLIFIDATGDLDLRNVSVTGTIVISPDIPHVRKLTINDDVLLDGRAGPAAGLALCAPGVQVTTVGRSNVVVEGIVYGGSIDLRGDPADRGGTTICGRVLAALPSGGAVHIRPTSGVELRAVPPATRWPLGLVAGSMFLEVTAVAER